MKRVIYDDQFGSIVEYTRYRGRRGKLVTDKYGRRNRDKPWIKEEIEQWRLSSGRRVEKIFVRRPERLMKTTYPGAFEDHDQDIYSAIRSTNVMTEVGKASSALIHIRGYDRNGEEIRMQSDVDLGQRHESQQLTMAAWSMLKNAGYARGTYYAIMQEVVRRGRQPSGRKPYSIRLSGITITITLMK